MTPTDTNSHSNIDHDIEFNLESTHESDLRFNSDSNSNTNTNTGTNTNTLQTSPTPTPTLSNPTPTPAPNSGAGDDSKCNDFLCPECNQEFYRGSDGDSDQNSFVNHWGNCPGICSETDEPFVGCLEIVDGEPGKDGAVKKCPYCNHHFSDSNPWIVCDLCRKYNTAGCIKHIVGVGVHSCFGLCLKCCRSDKLCSTGSLSSYANCKSLKIVGTCAEPHTGDALYVYSVITEKCNIRIRTNEIIPQRFITANANYSVQVLGRSRFDRLLDVYHKRSVGVTYRDGSINLYNYAIKYAEIYHKEDSQWLQSQPFTFENVESKYRISDVGEVKDNGFFVLPGVGDNITGLKAIYDDIQHTFDDAFPDWDEQNTGDNELLRKYCSYTVAHKGIRGMFFGNAYKGGKNCYDLSEKQSVDLKQDSVDESWRQYNYKSREANVNKAHVIESKLLEYLQKERKYDKFFMALNHLKVITSIVQFAIGQELPSIRKVFQQFLREPGLYDGNWLNNMDILKYGIGYLARSHIDKKPLIWPETDKQYLHLGPYAVWKGELSETQSLCHVSNGQHGCEWDPSSASQRRYGHTDLIPYTLYFMFNYGVYNGPTHSIHRKIIENMFEGEQYRGINNIAFTGDAHQVVFRPLAPKSQQSQSDSSTDSAMVSSSDSDSDSSTDSSTSD